jgi:hypothetical protein
VIWPWLRDIRFFGQLRLWYRRRYYRSGRVLSRFIAQDIIREIEIVDTQEIDTGIISARVRTWNVLYVVKGLAIKPDFGDVQRLKIEQLWNWDGASWGGLVPP